MNGLYEMLLFLFILGASAQFVNETNIFAVKAPDTGLTFTDESTARSLQSQASSTTIDNFSSVQLFWAFMRVIGMGILAMFTVMPLIILWLTAIGTPYALAVLLSLLFQVPITFVTLFGLYEFWTGRATA